MTASFAACQKGWHLNSSNRVPVFPPDGFLRPTWEGQAIRFTRPTALAVVQAGWHKSLPQPNFTVSGQSAIEFLRRSTDYEPVRGRALGNFVELQPRVAANMSQTVEWANAMSATFNRFAAEIFLQGPPWDRHSFRFLTRRRIKSEPRFDSIRITSAPGVCLDRIMDAASAQARLNARHIAHPRGRG